MKLKILFFLSSILFSWQLKAQLNYKVHEVNTKAGEGSLPGNFTLFNNNVYFFANDSAHGRELWCYKNGNVSLVADIMPGPASSVQLANRNTDYLLMATISEGLYFAAMKDTNDFAIFRYTGNGAPTVVFDIQGEDMFALRQMLPIHNKLYCLMNFEGSVKITVFNPANNQMTALPIPANLQVPSYTKLLYWPSRNRLYFNANSSLSNYHLYYFDFVTGQTIPIKSKTRVNYMFNPKILNNRMVFIDGLYPENLYESDGDSVINIISEDNIIKGGFGTLHEPYEAFCFMQDKVYFSAKEKSSGNINLYEYNPKSKQKLFVQSLKQNIAARSLMSYRSKLYFEDSGKIWINDLKKPPLMLKSIDTNFKMTFCNQTYLININDTLYGSVHIDGYPGHNHEFIRFYDAVLSVKANTFNPLSATLYPNPTTHDAYLDIQLNDAQTIQVMVTDVQGRIVYTNQAQLFSAGKHTIHLPTKELPTGGYIYRISDGQGTLLQSGKLMKE